MAAAGQRVAVCFGGPSVEHDVSIITAQQLMEALSERHRPIPIYLARDGRFWTGEGLRDVASFGGDEPEGAQACELRLGPAGGSGFVRPSGSRLGKDERIDVDVVLCAIHGTGGEDGALLGALELTDLPYAGGGVGPAAVGMNKATSKAVFRAAGLSVNPDLTLGREEFSSDPRATTERAAEAFGLPCYVKPISLGSSIGVARCTETDELEEALELCFELDRTALVEPALDEAIEINCAVLGRPGGEPRVSVCEQPVKQEELLTFEAKYMSGAKKAGRAEQESGSKSGDGMAAQDRLIPAPISDDLTEAIQDAARRAHRALGFAGIVRYDFLITDPQGDPGVILNEPNTVPGSFAFYLFDPIGISFPELGEALIDIAVAEAAERRATTRVFESVLLQSHRGDAS